MHSLNQLQIDRLAVLVSEWLDALRLEAVPAAETEPKFTAQVLLPWLKRHVDSLKKNGLYIRGDGGPIIKPVIWEGVPFLPDLAIVMGEEKYISFEVKLLRDQDPGGSLAKAVGQTVLYSRFGYHYSFGLVFDCRSSRGTAPELALNEKFEITPKANICIFS